MTSRGSWIALASFVAALSVGDATSLGAPPPGIVVDRIAVRYYAPETGGPGRPRFITERVLAFEARLEALVEDPDGSNGAYLDRDVRAAMERRLADGLLARLPLEHALGDVELDHLGTLLRVGIEERIGAGPPSGADLVKKAAREEGLDDVEVAALFRERARAALEIERAFQPVLNPTEEVLRETFRTAAHPYKGKTYEEARPRLLRWLVEGRLRAAENAFFQSARTRVKVTYLR